MESWLPAGFHGDLDSPLTRLVVQRLIDNGTPAPTWTTNSPIKERTRKGYQNRINAWFKSVDLTEDEVLALDHDDRCKLVEACLAEKAAESADSYLHSFQNAINWWAGENNIDSPVTEVAKAIKGQGKGRGKAEVLTSEELTALLVGLKKCEVVGGTGTSNPDSCVGWHLRTRAAILVAIACSIRINSELRHFKDDNILKIDDAGIHLRITETKMNVHRDIVIRPRGDELCPIAAIEDFYKWLKEHNLERPDGALLPYVITNRLPAVTAITDERFWWASVVRYLESQGFTMANKTPHGLRSMAITEAVNNGWSHAELRDLGGWASLNVAAGYARNSGANIDLFGEGA